MDRLGTVPLSQQPGAAWVYGYSTDVLGCVVERASGIPLDRFIRERITEPLGLTQPTVSHHMKLLVDSGLSYVLEKAVREAKGLEDPQIRLSCQLLCDHDMTVEVISRFAVDPEWLIYLPPTMSPYSS